MIDGIMNPLLLFIPFMDQCNLGILVIIERKKKKIKKRSLLEIEKIVKKTKEDSEKSWLNTLSLGLYSTTKTSFMSRCIELSRESMSLREHPKYFMIKAWERARELFLEIGADLTKNEILKEDEDIFYFTIFEMDELLSKKFQAKDIQKLVKRRRNEYKKYLKLQPPSILTSDGEDIRVMAKQDDNPNVLTGVGVSAGVCEGFAKIIIDPLKDTLQNGEIMVCIATCPGWTPLFNSCAGLITEAGSSLSHGAVISREMSLPCVVGIRDATKILKDGDRIKVDGRTGKVEIILRKGTIDEKQIK